MRQSKFLQIAGFMIALLSLTTQSTWAQTTVTLPAACQNCPTGPDSDGDGVPDATDACPGTPAGTPVGANGCPTAPAFPAGYVHCNGVITQVVDVTNPITGKTWMDRNLGASQVATSSTDAASYGDLFQWGRFADGHQCRTSGTIEEVASTIVPNAGNTWDGLFIINRASPFSWYLTTTNMEDVWQGVSGDNSPCPIGYRLPTEFELIQERLSWSSNNAAGAYASPLKLLLAGSRAGTALGAPVDAVGSFGQYWTRNVENPNSRYLFLTSSNAVMSAGQRVQGMSVRCIKN
ncbi:fibrobacter succinogenes major paralogous domain-containing protein [Arundinibacter roseus]|uniref:Uncharacterized protein n=1 Tax=Arundinibacter roseus TaxID=2070510 RepID=A0A4V2X8V8_9BACT|nr:FISUMP domain-containing protein [Arundinibacter roseus]TDB61345.1 hypothetical protein EZE20_19260 [Arundinibacter roseus]